MTAVAKVLVIVGLLASFAALIGVLIVSANLASNRPAIVPQVTAASRFDRTPRATPRYFTQGRLSVWWDERTSPATSTSSLLNQSGSNIHPADYAGPESCKECHRKNYAGWFGHTHRRMNELASEETVEGEFSEGAEISYLGGQARFFRAGNGYRMDLVRGSTRRRYEVTQTIGSRFFQYYVGKLLAGPESPQHQAYQVDQVLPFGYWLDRNEWVPVVHVGLGEVPEGQREDPFAENALDRSFSPYYECNSCHTTFPLGDELIRNFWALGRHPPFPLHWSMTDYLGESHRELIPGHKSLTSFSNEEIEQLMVHMQQFRAPEHAVTLGVSCEACHLGAKAHAEEKTAKPSFFPYSPHLFAETQSIATGPEHDNVNWACGRCHAGQRPYFAGGMATWNSTDYTDAMKGSCYSELTCIHCHNPHQTIGHKWSRSASDDDASCVTCHQEFEPDEALVRHTHHAIGSAGSRCMNCHMPRINEGLQDVVRTHTIFSPTKPEMIEANHPNACNLCHVDRTIDWTLDHFQEWYGATYAEDQLAAAYPYRERPAVVGWLKSHNEAVRLVATGALARSDDNSALPELIDVLDDPYLLNRQFAQISLEEKLDIRLLDFGYRFYMTAQERREPLRKIRAHVLEQRATP